LLMVERTNQNGSVRLGDRGDLGGPQPEQHVTRQ
jgi:hypothetical protein